MQYLVEEEVEKCEYRTTLHLDKEEYSLYHIKERYLKKI
jgi:hypothetical protein